MRHTKTKNRNLIKEFAKEINCKLINKSREYFDRDYYELKGFHKKYRIVLYFYNNSLERIYIEPKWFECEGVIKHFNQFSGSRIQCFFATKNIKHCLKYFENTVKPRFENIFNGYEKLEKELKERKAKIKNLKSTMKELDFAYDDEGYKKKFGIETRVKVNIDENICDFSLKNLSIEKVKKVYKLIEKEIFNV